MPVQSLFSKLNMLVANRIILQKTCNPPLFVTLVHFPFRYTIYFNSKRYKVKHLGHVSWISHCAAEPEGPRCGPACAGKQSCLSWVSHGVPSARCSMQGIWPFAASFKSQHQPSLKNRLRRPQHQKKTTTPRYGQWLSSSYTSQGSHLGLGKATLTLCLFFLFHTHFVSSASSLIYIDK